MYKPTLTPFLIQTHLIQPHTFRRSILNALHVHSAKICLCRPWASCWCCVSQEQKQNLTTKRDISPDIIRVQFREGVREVN